MSLGKSPSILERLIRDADTTVARTYGFVEAAPVPGIAAPKSAKRRRIVRKRLKREKYGPEAWSRYRKAPPEEPKKKEHEPEKQAPEVVVRHEYPPGWRKSSVVAQAFAPKEGAFERQVQRVSQAAHGVKQRLSTLVRPIAKPVGKLARSLRKKQEGVNEAKLSPAERKEYVKLVAKKSPWPGKKELIKGGVYMAPVPIPGAGIPVALGLKHAGLRQQARENVRRKRSMARTGKIGALVALGLIAKGMRKRRKKKKREQSED